MRPPPPAASLAALAIAALLAGCISAPAPGDLRDLPEVPVAMAPANVQVTTRNGPASELTMAVNPTDPLNLVAGAKDYTLGREPGPGCTEYNVWSGVYHTKDGGATWANFLMPGFPGDTTTNLLSHYTCNSDPVVAFGADGTAYYSGLAYGGTGEGGSGLCPGDAEATLCGRSIWIAKSRDGGATWEGFVNVVAADDGSIVGGALAAGTVLDKQWFATDPTDAQHLAMTWIHFAALGGGFYVSESRDGAATWTPPLLLAELAQPIVHQFAMPAFGPDGTLYVVWRNFGLSPFVGADGLPPSQVMFTKSAAPGVFAFPPARPIADLHGIPSPLAGEEFRVNSMPILAVDQGSGALYVAWPEQRGPQADIVVVRSGDGGETWSAPATVGPAEDGADQFMPWMVVDEDGGVDLVFYDRSYTGNTLLDITLARSTDRGATFGLQRASTQSWSVPEGCYHQAGFPFIGDYIALTASAGVLRPFWADGRTGRCEGVAAAVAYADVPAPAAGSAEEATPAPSLGRALG